ncbi:DUF998 domain-containing protein [Corynebacterium sp.]|uniref:DUF998 domain-containing protein n=1 Tax=Corynebacterium sp. TaxID=1720 RepID=UPI0026DD40C9|nr:DUF998 domain-containing protein [Corynebacterium sp.]MDO4609832.1 DUF998 domain-containing protein [Corynebacterium sp.]
MATGTAGSGAARITLSAVFAAAYSAWALEAVLDDGVSPLWGYASELAARSEPYGHVFAASDRVAGVIAVVVGLLWLVRRPPARVAAAGFVVWGAATVADSIARLPHVEVTPDRLGWRPGPGDGAAPGAAGAAGAMESAQAGLTGTVHAIASSVAQMGLVVAVVGLALAVPAMRRGAGGALTGAALLFAVLTSITATLFEMVGVNLILGLWQRLCLAAASAAVVVAAVADVRGGRDATGGGDARRGRRPARPHRRRR